MTEQELRQIIVATASAWEGATKGDTKHKQIIDIYNSYVPRARGYKVSYTDNWCAAFVSAIAITAELTDIIPTECSCNEMIKLFQKLGRWVEDDAYVPQPGDIIMYYWKDGTDYATTDQKNPPNHVGYVVSVNGNDILVIEGNMSSKSVVGYRHVQVNGRYIRGYCCPDYASKAADEPWYAEDWSWATGLILFDGTRPEESITRAEVATVLRRFEKYLRSSS